jgi:AP-1 complex subunit beta-1
MTVGKDVSGLFQSVIKCLEYNDIELKKLVNIFLFFLYIYIIKFKIYI